MMNHARRPLLGLALFTLAPALFAQSGVTFYGQTDIALRYSGNYQGSEKSKLSLGSSGLYSSRFGFKGEEDLGSGNRAIFQLEGGFSTDTGRISSQSPGAGRTNLFGRQSIVGIAGDWGQLTAGRQHNALSVLYKFHPVGDHFFVGGDHFFSGYRFDNSLTYKKKIGDFSAELGYGFGEQVGGLALKSTVGGNIEYQRGAFHTAIAYLQNRSTDGGTIGRNANIGASYALTPALSLYGGHAINQESGDSRRQRNITFVSAGYKINPLWGVYGSYYRYRQSDCQGRCWKKPGDPDNVSGGIDTAMTGYAVSRDKGHANIATLITTYSLSRRTTLYAATDWLLARNGAASDHHYASSKENMKLDSLRHTHFMVGMRHAF
jgi:predicted porin